MIFAWTKQFLIATGFFAILLTTTTTNRFVKEQQLVKKQLENKKDFRVSTENSSEAKKLKAKVI